MKRIGILAWVGMALFVSAASAQDNVPITKTLRVRNLRSAVVAWWIDPEHNTRPAEFANADSAGGWADDTMSNPRLTAVGSAFANPYKSDIAKSPIAPPEAPAGSTPAMFALPKGVVIATNVSAQNAIFAYGTPDGLAELEKIISVLDQPLRQLEIEVKSFSLTDKGLKSLSELLSNSTKQTVGTKSIFQKLDAAAIETRLKELAAQKQVGLINAPRITALNNMTVNLAQSRTTPAVISFKDVNGKLQTAFDSTRRRNVRSVLGSKLNVGVTSNFIVTPTIYNDGTITLNMRPTKILVVTGSNKGMPVQTLESVTCIANVHDGETIALTGFTDSFFKLPLSNAKNMKNQKTEKPVIFLVTTRIVNRNALRFAAND